MDRSSDVFSSELDTGDDCIAIKSGRDGDGRRIGIPSENIIIEHCLMKDGHGGVVLGSEVSGGVRNVFALNNTMDSPNLDRVLRLKTSSSRSEEHTTELQSLMRTSYAVFCLIKKKQY